MRAKIGNRAESSGISLTEVDAAVVKGMLARGDRQHDIAAWFGVNGGRIAEIATGRRFIWVKMTTEHLPPPGPYLSGRQSTEIKWALETALVTLRNAEARLKKIAHAPSGPKRAT